MADIDGFVDMSEVLDALDEETKENLQVGATKSPPNRTEAPTKQMQNKVPTSLHESPKGGTSPGSGDSACHPIFTLSKDLIMKLEMEFPDQLVKESLSGYQFRNRGILLRALLHRTYKQSKRPRNKTCCDPLDYIGDYVLKFIISQYILEHCPQKQKESLAQRRSIVECQEAYAFLAVKNNFHKYVFIRQSDDGGQDWEHLKVYIETVKNVQTLTQLFEVEKRKCFIHNYFQSVAGAIYVDSGYDLKTVEKIYLPMLKSYLDEAISVELD